MKRKILLAILTLAVIALIVYAKNKADDFSLAESFPPGALVYAQTSDLPALIKLWNESNFKEKYLASRNFEELKNRHLGRKLGGRWQEFNDAAGFPIDLETFAGLAADKAAIAVYDIGKLDFVFIAPISKEVFAATRFVQNRNNYTEQTLEDGTTVYRVAVEADRGRQKQELIFTNVKDRFILTTNEKLLVATLNNLDGKTAKNSLAETPEFKSLREKIEPRLATVWINQTALNDDYYFKRYWLMSDVSALKNFRAGIFDFDASEEGKIVERRKFLLARPIEIKSLTDAEANKMLAFLPANIPFYRLEAATDTTASAAIENIVFERRSSESANASSNRNRDSYYDEDRDFASRDDYSSLTDNFDQNIYDTDDLQTTGNPIAKPDFAALLQTAQPQSVLTFTEPKILPFPLFAEFDRAALIHLAAPKDFDTAAFESKVASAMATKVLISAPGTKLSWETKNENNFAWRELNLPMIGQTVSYILLNENNLLVTDDSEFLQEISAVGRTGKTESFFSGTSFSEFSRIDLAGREKSYDLIFAELQKENNGKNFFAENIGSFLDSISKVKTVEVKKFYKSDILEEELTINCQ